MAQKKKPSNRMSKADWDKYAPRKGSRPTAKQRKADKGMKKAAKRHKTRKL